MAKSNVKTKVSSKTQADIYYPDRFNVVLINDDYTPMEFVIHLLIEIFNKSINQAKDITLTIHQEGRAIAGTYNFEIGEQKVQEATVISRHNGHPLQITLEKV
jgi:ATP-dependent Clp protease adaptor protein ClpS